MAEPNKPKELVLVVEDETLIRMHSVDMIRDFGFEGIEAVNADEAVSLLETIPEIKVVFTDIQMPGSMDGLLLAAVIRDRWPPVALLVVGVLVLAGGPVLAGVLPRVVAVLVGARRFTRAGAAGPAPESDPLIIAADSIVVWYWMSIAPTLPAYCGFQRSLYEVGASVTYFGL